MKVKVLFFGMSKDLTGHTEGVFDIENELSVKEFQKFLIGTFPNMKKMESFAIAVNEVYAANDFILSENDTIAIIPPVSGG